MNHALLCRSGALGYVRHLTLSSFSGAAQWPTVKGCGLTQNFEFVEPDPDEGAATEVYSITHSAMNKVLAAAKNKIKINKILFSSVKRVRKQQHSTSWCNIKC